MYTNIKGLRKKARAYAFEHFAGTEVTVESTGETVAITRTGIRHGTRSQNPHKLKAVVALPGLLADAEKIAVETDRKGRPEVKAYHRYRSTIDVGGQIHRIGLVVRETQEGKKYYDHFLWEENEPAESGGADEQLPSPPIAGSDENVPNPGTDVKPTPKATGGEGMAAAGQNDAYGPIDFTQSTVATTDTPKVRQAAKEAGDAPSVLRDILSVASPGHVSNTARRGARFLRMSLSELAQKDVAAGEAYRKLHKVFQWMAKDDIVAFIDRIENGQADPDPHLERIASTMREQLSLRCHSGRAVGRLADDLQQTWFPDERIVDEDHRVRITV